MAPQFWWRRESIHVSASAVEATEDVAIYSRPILELGGGSR